MDCRVKPGNDPWGEATTPQRHCEPTGPARSGRPDDKLREAIHIGAKQWIASSPFGLLAMTVLDRTKTHYAPRCDLLECHCALRGDVAAVSAQERSVASSSVSAH